MTIVNGFDIDTVEGATAYLESEGLDVEAYVEKGLAELKKRKALDLADVVGRSEQLPKCEHKNIKREDGLDECLDCGVRNY